MEARESEDSRHAKWARSAAAYSDLALQLTTYQLSNQVLADKGKVRVSVSLFGRPTAVELDYLQLRGH